MNSKLSLSNFHSFGKQNPFIKERSFSSNKVQLQTSPSYGEYLNGDYISSRTKANEKPYSYQTACFKDVNNICPSSQRGFSASKQTPCAFQSINSIHNSNRQTSLRQSTPLTTQYKIKCTQQNIVYLLKNQAQCLEQFRLKVESDKCKLNNDFQDFKQTINNTVDDLKLTISAHIDSEYQNFVNSFRMLKSGYVSYCKEKGNFWKQRQGVIERAEKGMGIFGQRARYPGIVDFENVNNQMLLINLIEDVKQCQENLNYRQFSLTQQKMLKPLFKMAQIMTNKLNVESFYRPEVAHQSLRLLQQQIQLLVHKVYQRIDSFVLIEHEQRRKLKEHETNVKQNFYQQKAKERVTANDDYQLNLSQSSFKLNKVYQNKDQKIKIVTPPSYYCDNNDKKENFSSTAYTSQFAGSNKFGVDKDNLIQSESNRFYNNCNQNKVSQQLGFSRSTRSRGKQNVIGYTY